MGFVMSYKAIVAKIHTRPLIGADNLLIGTCGSYQVVVGKDTIDGQLGVFFESDGQLSEEFAQQNDLVRRKSDDGSCAGGMFEVNRRVKSIKLRGARSEGFWCPIDKFDYTSVDKFVFVEGFQFDELNGHKICGKYFTPATVRTGVKTKRQRDNVMFHKHIDTGMFRREYGSIPFGAMLYVSEKLHGTSQRYGHVLDNEPISRWWCPDFVASLLGLPLSRKVWKHVVGTRNVILEHKKGETFYGDEKFRYDVVEAIKLHKGEVVYGEVVGYANEHTPIMATQDLSSLKDKRVKNTFGDKVVYSYGCLPGQCKFYVYRITQVNEDGYAVELSWNQVVKRSKEIGLETVPLLSVLEFTEDDVDYVKDIVSTLTENEDFPHSSVIDPDVIREGVVVRWESEHGIGWLKNKSFVFGVLEGYLKENEDYVDAEESA